MRARIAAKTDSLPIRSVAASLERLYLCTQEFIKQGLGGVKWASNLQFPYVMTSHGGCPGICTLRICNGHILSLRSSRSPPSLITIRRGSKSGRKPCPVAGSGPWVLHLVIHWTCVGHKRETWRCKLLPGTNSEINNTKYWGSGAPFLAVTRIFRRI